MAEPALDRALPNVGPGPNRLTLADLTAPVEPADPAVAVSDVGAAVSDGLAVTAADRDRTVLDRLVIDALLARADRRT
ncbi:hypothetical protein [Natrinema versiforme]|uniref:Uncharacterized protein n=1 Tax=Natrinema versiforme JCM 10478 TaxID=1227496 RepID=L9XUX2_9EURY|nr:hypothetical protein [Natrinema versiforme]ELY65535.1 hypothetical protein C489_14695 [Natrinema versiforme JCM 10478]